MARVLVLRQFDAPQVFDELQAVEDKMAWCLEENNVTFLRTFFSLDRKRMLCGYEAPDAEAVRISQRKAGLPFEKVWSVELLSRLLERDPFEDDQGRSTVVCERTYPMAIPPPVLGQISASKRHCLEANNVDLLDSYIPGDNKGSVCVFAAPDAESVRRANRTAALPFDVIWSANVYRA